MRVCGGNIVRLPKRKNNSLLGVKDVQLLPEVLAWLQENWPKGYDIAHVIHMTKFKEVVSGDDSVHFEGSPPWPSSYITDSSKYWEVLQTIKGQGWETEIHLLHTSSGPGTLWIAVRKKS